MILDDESTWPIEVIDFLTANHDLFLAWEQQRRGRQPARPVSGPEYDAALGKLRPLLDPHTLRGFHCTRLTDAEIEHILTAGMQPPDVALLHRRIQAVQDAGLIDRSIGDRLRGKNLGEEEIRAGKTWFCFFPPALAGQSGIERFFRYWGGEALYGLHEDDPETGPVLREIGVPCVIEADVPVAMLAPHGLEINVPSRFVVSRGFSIGDSLLFESRATSAIPATHIRRVYRYPDAKFCELTDCRSWRPALA